MNEKFMGCNGKLLSFMTKSILIFLVALTGTVTYIFCVNKETNNNQTSENITSNVDLSLENCLNCADGITYFSARKSIGDIGVSLSINTDKKSVTATIDFNKLEGTNGIRSYEINGFSKNLKKAFVGANGQSKNATFLLFIMEDGTLEATPLYKMINDEYELNLTNGVFKSTGPVEEAKNIIEFYIVDGCRESCWIETLAFTKSGQYYTLTLK